MQIGSISFGLASAEKARTSAVESVELGVYVSYACIFRSMGSRLLARGSQIVDQPPTGVRWHVMD